MEEGLVEIRLPDGAALRLAAPIKIRDGSPEYFMVVTSGRGVDHYINKDLTYDGWGKDRRQGKEQSGQKMVCLHVGK